MGTPLTGNGEGQRCAPSARQLSAHRTRARATRRAQQEVCLSRDLFLCSRCRCNLPPKRPPCSNGAASLSASVASQFSCSACLGLSCRRFSSTSPVCSGRSSSGSTFPCRKAVATDRSLPRQPPLEWFGRWEPRGHQEYDSGAHGRNQCCSRVLIDAHGPGIRLYHRVGHVPRCGHLVADILAWH